MSHFTAWGIPFTYNNNKSGPNIDPWGTQQVRFLDQKPFYQY